MRELGKYSNYQLFDCSVFWKLDSYLWSDFCLPDTSYFLWNISLTQDVFIVVFVGFEKHLDPMRFFFLILKTLIIIAS